MSCSNQIKICAFTHGLCTFVGREDECPHCGKCSGSGGNLPTIAELCAMYQKCAEQRHAKTGQISDGDIKRSLYCIGRFCVETGIPDSAKISEITRRNLSTFAAALAAQNMTPATIKTTLVSIQRMTARWARNAYFDLGYEVQPIDLPEMAPPGGEYQTPPAEKLTAFKVWYQTLAASKQVRLHVYCLLMYHFAMRNGDVDRLTWGAFSEERGKRILTYTPHKTRLKSKRVVRVEVCDLDWFYIQRMGVGAPDQTVFPGNGGNHDYLRKKLNAEMRKLGFDGSKGAYNLRKMCGDEYARRYDVEMAKVILGHRLVTGSTAHYVDGSRRVVPSIWG